MPNRITTRTDPAVRWWIVFEGQWCYDDGTSHQMGWRGFRLPLSAATRAEAETEGNGLLAERADLCETAGCANTGERRLLRLEGPGEWVPVA